MLNQIIEEAEEYKLEFYRKSIVTRENNKASNREREKVSGDFKILPVFVACFSFLFLIKVIVVVCMLCLLSSTFVLISSCISCLCKYSQISLLYSTTFSCLGVILYVEKVFVQVILSVMCNLVNLWGSNKKTFSGLCKCSL